MSNDKPRVSIGLPVFNGEKYLEEALNSILAQIYQDFELIISDNASTDNTQRICRTYAAKDRRIRYYRNERNLGASKNFNRVFELSSGEYFKWVAYDDVLALEFLSRCVSVLDQDPSIVLCYCKTGRIDEHGALVGTCDDSMFVRRRGRNMRIDSRKPHERFGDLISIYNPCWWVFGLIRASSLRRTSLIENYINADRNLLAELGLIGQIYEIPEYLYFRRDHPQSYTKRYYEREISFPSYKEQLAWWKGNAIAGRINIPNWRNSLEYFKSVRRVPLTWSERLLCYTQIGMWFIREGWKVMGYEVKMALRSARSCGSNYEKGVVT